jgi:hypothetical protein
VCGFDVIQDREHVLDAHIPGAGLHHLYKDISARGDFHYLLRGTLEARNEKAHIVESALCIHPLAAGSEIFNALTCSSSLVEFIAFASEQKDACLFHLNIVTLYAGGACAG